MKNRSIIWSIAVPYVLLILAVIGGLGIYLVNFTQTTYQENLTAQLLGEARVTAADVQPLILSEQWEAINQTANRIALLSNGRVTIILPSGKVVSDSEVPPTQLENHLNRPEVQRALSGIESTEIRMSNSTLRDTMYAAVPILDNGKVIGIARLAVPLTKIQADLQNLRRVIWLAMAAAGALAIGLALLITSLRIRPLQKLTQAVQRLSQGEFPEIIPTHRSDEVGQLTQAFNRMATKLSAQINELQTEQIKLASVLENLTDGVIILDSQGFVQLINPAAASLFGGEIDQSHSSRTLAEVVRHHQIVDLWHQAQVSDTTQLTTIENAPEKTYFQVIATPLHRNLQGSTLLVFQDLTRMRQLEIVRRDFVSNVSHELRTPLASLKALVETLQEGALEDPPAAHSFLQRMEYEIDNLTQMVQELLELSRIESGKVPLDRHPVLPYDLLSSAGDRMRLQAERAGLHIQIETAPTLPSIRVDFARIEQVLINLIHNAIKFTPPGGQITLSAFEHNDKVVFSVKDTGSGIAPDDLQRIFERFYKTDRARTSKGTGLGLSIARHTIEAHGGRIWAESEPGHGSTFYFEIPKIEKN